MDDDQLELPLAATGFVRLTATEQRAFVAAKLAFLQSQAQRPMRLRSCRTCTRPFVMTRSDARYCSVRCRVRAHRAKVQSKPPSPG